MTAARQSNAASVIAQIPMGDVESLRVSIDAAKGRKVIDVRVFSRFTAARVMMPTSRAIAVDPALLPQLIEALQTAWRAISAATVHVAG